MEHGNGGYHDAADGGQSFEKNGHDGVVVFRDLRKLKPEEQTRKHENDDKSYVHKKYIQVIIRWGIMITIPHVWLFVNDLLRK